VRIEKVKTLDGDVVEQMIPENEKDERELKRLADKEEIEVSGSFGDERDPEETDDILGFE
jgi:hypothetical protein